MLFGAAVWLWLPDSPLTAHFLTTEERAQAILRIKSNHSGIEQKHFKKAHDEETSKVPAWNVEQEYTAPTLLLALHSEDEHRVAVSLTI